MSGEFYDRLTGLEKAYELLLSQPNQKAETGNGIYDRYQYPVLTAQHTPLFWRYDLNFATNPFLIERFVINAVLNAGAIKWNDKYLLIARVEASDRKSFFAVAESPNGIDTDSADHKNTRHTIIKPLIYSNEQYSYYEKTPLPVFYYYMFCPAKCTDRSAKSGGSFKKDDARRKGGANDASDHCCNCTRRLVR